jgi:hypothetical protein
MGEESGNKTLSFVERMKQRASAQKVYGGECQATEANVGITTCPNCGAGRAENDGLTKCAYCGYVFITVELGDGINIKSKDNSETV